MIPVESSPDPGARLTESEAARPRRCIAERWVLVALAAILALLLWGQFLQPHGDFYEFRATGRALLHGDLPPTLKRSPAWPLLISVTSHVIPWHWFTQVPPEQAAAQSLNGLALIGITVVFHRLASRWAAGAAGYLTLLLLLAPTLWWAAAGTLLEPLLILLVLTACERSAAAGRGRYVAAGAAMLVRPDCAGALLGVAVADLLRREPWRRVAVRTGAAAVPALAWIGLTAALWASHSRDHYLKHLRFDAAAAQSVLGQTVDCATGDRRFLAVLEVQEPAEWLTRALPGAMVVLAIAGVVVIVRRRRVAEVAAPVAFAVAYLAGVAGFEFSVDRYYLAPAVILTLLAAPGAAALGRAILASRAKALVIAVGGSAALFLIGGEATWWALFHPRDALTTYGVLCATCLASIAVPLTTWRSRVASRPLPTPEPGEKAESSITGRNPLGARIVVALGCVLLASSAARQLPVLFAEHDRIPPLVAAARWTREHLPPPARVLSGVGGLLAMYAVEDESRFPGFEQIQAESWPAILEECRAKGVGYVLWYADFFAEQGESYIRQWRLDRFVRLDEEPPPEEIEVIRRFSGERPVWIGRIRAGPGSAVGEK